ncbi:restriction endonuclease subunit S [Psychrobacter piscatorii]|uniref:Type I restriction modification DNA specificity domain-containing protein n=1 Tax=Psychrobacter piscatorii TaxID=554343 RepID=A0A0T6DT41_9GAMM|nr:restriction endonuclease subunit S [Psychrobacter piscatorii]KRU22904.1 hypothetical protein AS194_06645 [Psychrobacter piscatorii]
MAKYEQYAEYKDSGIEWLGDIPKDWQIKRLKYLCKINTGTKDTINAIEDGIYPFFVRSQTVERINSYGADCEAVLTAGDGVGVGKVYHYINGKFDYHQRVYMLSEFNQITGRFLYYYLSSNFYKVALQGNAKSTVDSLRLPQFLNFEFSLPSLEEQPLIVSYLDHETAQIDTLIEKQQTLIQLLKEKRQAVISHAVTKGLNPDAPLKDSGVEWLGGVPEHWEIGRLKNVLRIRNGRDYKEVEVESGGYPVYGSGGIFKRSSDYLFDGESVLFGRKGTVDKPLLVSGKFWTVDTMFYSEVFSNAKPNYIYHQALLFPFDQLSTNTALPSMTQENLLELGFVIPSFDEQEQICQYLSDKLKVFSNLVSKAEQAIQLMQERRTALISAAVTGKIDVRGWVEHDGIN